MMTQASKKHYKLKTAHTEFDTFDILELSEYVHELRKTIRAMVRQQKRLRRAESLLTLRATYTSEEKQILDRNIADMFRLYRNLNADYTMVYHKTMDELAA